MKKTKFIAIGLLVIFCALFIFKSCSTERAGPKGNKTGSTTIQEITPPAFAVDSAVAFVKKQVAFGPRVPGTKPHQLCGDWLVAEMQKYGANVIEQKEQAMLYDGTPQKIRNIIAQFHPENPKRILLAAHWDTRPFADKDKNPSNEKKPIDGANDGGSGVAVLLEIARIIQLQKPDVGIDIAFWDLEDWGKPEFVKEENPEDYLSWCLGSQSWLKTPHKQPYNAMFGILLDMVGAPGATFNKEGISMLQAPDVINKVWKTAAKLGYGNYFTENETGEIIDDHLFMNRAGIRSIDIVDMRQKPDGGFNGYGFGDFHHTLNDNIEAIDPKTLEAVGRTLTHVIYNTR